MAVKPRSLLYWEAKRRLDLLVAYRQKIVDYYAKAHWDRKLPRQVDTSK